MAPKDTPARGGKKAYERPEYRKVPLRPEEAVLGSCKTAPGVGPIGGSCTMPIACSSSGS